MEAGGGIGMLAYNGTEPYVFFSYSHADTELVEKIIIELRQRLCRVWFDEGLTPGESFNDELAERIINCECFVVALTEHSVFSNYVKAEINYSVSKGKKIIALIIDNTDIPPGIDIMISPYQHIQFNSETDHKKMTEVLSDALPDKVFSTRKVPFLEYGKFEFYLEKNDIQFDDPLGRDIRRNEFEIICVEKCAEINIRTPIFRFGGDYAYDIEYYITQCKPVGDDFYIGKVTGLFIINIIANCCLSDEIGISSPYGGPDFNCLLVFSLRVPFHGLPSFTLIDYRYIAINREKGYRIQAWREIKKGHGRGLSDKFERLLYRPFTESYHFFGADRVSREILDLYDALSHVWCADTCEPSLRDTWSAGKPMVGQGTVTAFLVRDMIGGAVYGIPLDNGEYHCYNEDRGGITFDFTSEQFEEEELNYENNNRLEMRQYFTKDEQQQRYKLLKERLENYLNECNQSTEN